MRKPPLGDEVTGIVISLPLPALHEVREQVLAVDGRAIHTGDLLLTSTSDPRSASGRRGGPHSRAGG